MKSSPQTTIPSKNQASDQRPEDKPSFWERFAFLSLSFEAKAEITEATLEDIKGDGLYWIQLFLSSLIASFGLLQNSVAVIIGAMLIAPLLQPIKGIAFGITTGQNTFLWKSSLILATSIIISVCSAFLFALLIPLRIETAEIVARTAPNLLDLFVAVASAVIAVLAIYYKKLSETTAGVAMAAALLPTLCVVGIELSLNNFGAAWGSFFLFLTNLFAILAVGVIVFLIYGFSPHHEDTQQRTTKSVLILFILLALISIPLFSSLTRIADRIQLETKAKQIVETSLQNTIPSAKLEELTLNAFDANSASYFSVIKIPEDTDFFLETRNQIRDQLGTTLGREVTLEIEIIPVASIISQQEQAQAELPGKDRQILNILKGFFDQPNLKSAIIDVEVIENSSELVDETIPPEQTDEQNTPSDEQNWTVKTIFTVPSGETFDPDTQQQLENEVQELFPNDEFTFLWVPLSQTVTGKAQPTETANDKYLKDVTLRWESFFKRSFPQGSEVNNLNITWTMTESDDRTQVVFDPNNIAEYSVQFDLLIPQEDLQNITLIRERARLFARITFDKPVNISMRVIPFTKQEVSTNPN